MTRISEKRIISFLDTKLIIFSREASKNFHRFSQRNCAIDRLASSSRRRTSWGVMVFQLGDFINFYGFSYWIDGGMVFPEAALTEGKVSDVFSSGEHYWFEKFHGGVPAFLHPPHLGEFLKLFPGCRSSLPTVCSLPVLL